jgi:hypothetical protein
VSHLRGFIRMSDDSFRLADDFPESNLSSGASPFRLDQRRYNSRKTKKVIYNRSRSWFPLQGVFQADI